MIIRAIIYKILFLNFVQYLQITGEGLICVIFSISDMLAQQIVDTVKGVCGQDINCIDKNGIIISSTNEKRVGTFHEIGRQVALTGKTIEVHENDTFTGTQQGVNLPIYCDHTLLAVVGISGEPDEVRKYAFLVQKIANLLIRERELASEGRNLSERKRYLLQSFLQPAVGNKEYLNALVYELQVNISKSKRFLIVHLNDDLAKGDLHLFDYAAEEFFQEVGIDLFAYSYPNKYYAVIEDDIFARKRSAFQQLNQMEQSMLRISVGVPVGFFQLNESYETARIAWRSMRSTALAFACADDLSLEMLLRAIDYRSRQAFIDKTVKAISDSDILLLKTYFQCDCSLNKTSEALHLHKNTLQYQLKKIATLSGLDPRKFHEGVLLYLGTQINDFSKNMS